MNLTQPDTPIGQFKRRINKIKTKEYVHWCAMNDRCTDISVRKPAYVGCVVHPDFKDFQYFALWCQTQIGFGKDGYALDKDILFVDNKTYGPTTCVFVPQSLNNLLITRKRNKGNWPTGVSYDANTESLKKFKCECSINGRPKNLGRFSTPDEAFEVYLIAKLGEIHRQANYWKDQIDSRVYETLINYDVETLKHVCGQPKVV